MVRYSMGEEPGTASSPDESFIRLHADNERLRLRVLELLKLMEDEVTDKVEAELRAEDWERQATALQEELDALRNTKIMRVVAPVRRLYAKVRTRG